MDTLSTNDKEVWCTIRQELEDIGITVVAFDANKEFIFEWILNAIEHGAFEEQVLNNSSTADKYVDSSEEELEGNFILRITSE
jgi:hypothetical protein